MLGLLIPAVLATAIALVIGGSTAGWTQTRIRWWPIALLSLVSMLVLYNPPLDRQPWAIAAGPALWVVAKLAMIAVLLLNAAGDGPVRWPWLVAALGVSLNVLVVVANGGYMPQSPAARAAVWGPERASLPQSPDRLRNTTLMTADSRLPWLADVIPQPGWLPRRNVVSVGDLLLASGIAAWAFQTTLAGRRRERLPLPRVAEGR